MLVRLKNESPKFQVDYLRLGVCSMVIIPSLIVVFAAISANLTATEIKANNIGSTFAGPIVVKKWTGEEFQEIDLVSLSTEGETLAEDAERAFLLRINGQAKDLFDAAYLRGVKTPVYVIADKKFQLPKGPPTFKFAKDLTDLEKIASEAGSETIYVSLRTLGMPKNRATPAGVVIEYKCYAKQPKSDPADAETGTRSGQMKLLKIASSFGATFQVLVVRDGDGLCFFEGQMEVN